ESFKELSSDPRTADRARIWAPKAEQARRLADQAVDYIESLKKRVLQEADFNPQTGDFKEDNLEAPTRVMTDPGKAGDSLHMQLGNFKKALLDLDPEIR